MHLHSGCSGGDFVPLGNSASIATGLAFWFAMHFGHTRLSLRVCHRTYASPAAFMASSAAAFHARVTSDTAIRSARASLSRPSSAPRIACGSPAVSAARIAATRSSWPVPEISAAQCSP